MVPEPQTGLVVNLANLSIVVGNVNEASALRMVVAAASTAKKTIVRMLTPRLFFKSLNHGRL